MRSKETPMILTIELQRLNQEPITTTIDVGNSIIRSIELRADDKPVMIRPFWQHGPRLHTICRRENDEIDEMEM